MKKSFDIVAVGEAMVEFNQTSDPGGRTYLQGFGGDTSNVVIAAARQGSRCAYVTRLGDDDFGRMCLELWSDEGVNTQAVEIDPLAATGIYFVRHEPSGHKFSYLRAGSAASKLAVSSRWSELFASTRYLHVSGISQAISPAATAAVGQAITLAHTAGAKVSYDPNLRLKLWSVDRAREVITETIGRCDVFLPSLDDVQLISGLSSPTEIVRWSHQFGAPLVVLKLGKEGALVSQGNECVHVKAFSVDAVDATGAGDCFDGSFLSQLASGADPVSAAKWASAAAAIATTGYGAVLPLPQTQQICEMIESQAKV